MIYFKKSAAAGVLMAAALSVTPTLAQTSSNDAAVYFNPFTYLTGGAVLSAIQDPHEIYAGTKVIGGISEQGLRANSAYVFRYGGEAGFETSVSHDDCHPDWGYSCEHGFFADGIFALGKTYHTETATVGVDGVTGTGFTPIYGAGFAGGGTSLTTQGTGWNTWGRIDAGYQKNLVPIIDMDGAGNYEPSFSFRLNPFYEYYHYNGSGSGNGQSGAWENYSIQSTDSYFGVSAGASVKMKPSDGLYVQLGGRVDIAYHYGEGSYSQNINGMVRNLNYAASNVQVGGAADATIKYHLAENTYIFGSAEAAILPGVTGFNGRYGPLDAPAYFGGMNLGRFTISGGLKGKFD